MNDAVVPPLGAGTVTGGVLQYLGQTKPWVRFMSVMTFIAAGFMVIGALGMFAMGATAGMSTNNPLGGMAGGMGIVLALFYLVLAGLYVAPAIFLGRYASAIGRLHRDGSISTLEEALMHQRSFWRYVGIMGLIGLILMALALVVGIVAGIYAAMAR